MALPKINRTMTPYGATTPTFIPMWQYRFEPAPVEAADWIEQLNALGADGWELVDTVAEIEDGHLVQKWLLKKPDVSDLEALLPWGD
jgi:hypothetical protein